MSTPPKPTIRLEVPDTTFRFTPEERAGILPTIDVDALERLLAAVEPDARPMILEGFLARPPGEQGHALVRLGDPVLQAILEEVWAPVWDLFPPEALDTEVAQWPGRELARQRRQERETRQRQE